MRAEGVTNTIKLALTASDCDQAIVRHKPRLLGDNGSCYISGDLAECQTSPGRGCRRRKTWAIKGPNLTFQRRLGSCEMATFQHQLLDLA